MRNTIATILALVVIALSAMPVMAQTPTPLPAADRSAEVVDLGVVTYPHARDMADAYSEASGLPKACYLREKAIIGQVAAGNNDGIVTMTRQIESDIAGHGGNISAFEAFMTGQDPYPSYTAFMIELLGTSTPATPPTYDCRIEVIEKFYDAATSPDENARLQSFSCICPQPFGLDKVWVGNGYDMAVLKAVEVRLALDDVTPADRLIAKPYMDIATAATADPFVRVLFALAAHNVALHIGEGYSIEYNLYELAKAAAMANKPLGEDAPAAFPDSEVASMRFVAPAMASDGNVAPSQVKLYNQHLTNKACSVFKKDGQPALKLRFEKVNDDGSFVIDGHTIPFDALKTGEFIVFAGAREMVTQSEGYPKLDNEMFWRPYARGFVLFGVGGQGSITGSHLGGFGLGLQLSFLKDYLRVWADANYLYVGGIDTTDTGMHYTTAPGNRSTFLGRVGVGTSWYLGTKWVKMHIDAYGAFTPSGYGGGADLGFEAYLGVDYLMLSLDVSTMYLTGTGIDGGSFPGYPQTEIKGWGMGPSASIRYQF